MRRKNKLINILFSGALLLSVSGFNVLAEEEDTYEENEQEETYEVETPTPEPTPETIPESNYIVINFLNSFGAYGEMAPIYLSPGTNSLTLPACGFSIPDMHCNGYTIYRDNNTPMYFPGDVIYVEANTTLYPTFLDGPETRKEGEPDAYIKDGVVVFGRDNAATPGPASTPTPTIEPISTPTPTPRPTPTIEPKEPIETAKPQKAEEKSVNKLDIFLYMLLGLGSAGLVILFYYLVKNGLLEVVEDDEEEYEEYEDDSEENQK